MSNSNNHLFGYRESSEMVTFMLLADILFRVLVCFGKYSFRDYTV